MAITLFNVLNVTDFATNGKPMRPPISQQY